MNGSRPRLLHLVGSAVDEFFADLSILYARDCLEATAPVADAVIAFVSPDGFWRFPSGLSDDELAVTPALALADALFVIDSFAVDAMVPHMFCRPGMTTYRGLFELLGIPYLGNRPDVMALAADKAMAKAVVAAAGVAVPAGTVFVAGPNQPVRSVTDLPVVVKPVDGDNSVGLTLVREASQLGAAVTAACEHGRAALVEQYIPLGRELRCGVLERDGGLAVLPLEEYAVDPVTKPIRDADDKLASAAAGGLSLVAKDAAHAWIVDPADPVCRVVDRAARRAYAALGCRHYGLFDFRVDPDGQPWFLEAGPYCSFARQSVIATMAAAAGIAVAQLLTIVLDAALHERTA